MKTLRAKIHDILHSRSPETSAEVDNTVVEDILLALKEHFRVDEITTISTRVILNAESLKPSDTPTSVNYMVLTKTAEGEWIPQGAIKHFSFAVGVERDVFPTIGIEFAELFGQGPTMRSFSIGSKFPG